MKFMTVTICLLVGILAVGCSGNKSEAEDALSGAADAAKDAANSASELVDDAA